jgi:phosphatidylserine/phosphatidylglycerophosphate/cardiolipin synthase-like enzyme
MMICISFNVFEMNAIRRIPKTKQLCFNNVSPQFGTTHFIVGHKEKNLPKQKLKKHQSFVDKNRMSAPRTSLIDQNRISQSFFTTEHDLSPILLEVMQQAKKRLYIAAFSLTDQRIVKCLIDAHNNGIDVCVITDANNMKQMHSKIKHLVDKNVPVWYYDHTLNPRCKKNGLSDPCMHHKFMIVDDDMVITGSANLTRAGQNSNIENINILRDKTTMEEYLAEIKRLMQFCIKYLSHIIA